MKRKKIIISLFCATAGLLTVSCGGSGDDGELNNVEIVDTTDNNLVENTDITIEYSVPTPNELFEIINN